MESPQSRTIEDICEEASELAFDAANEAELPRKQIDGAAATAIGVVAALQAIRRK